MSDSIKALGQKGVTIFELLVVIAISSLMLLALMTISVYVYGDTVRASMQAQLAAESQTVLRSIVEELRQSSSIRTTNANPDAYAPSEGWTTSNTNLILIISTPALDGDNNFIISPDTGNPYQDEIIYYASGTNLYRRTLVDPNATGNTARTTCPPQSATNTCGPDTLMTANFRDMNFVFYNQDNAITTSIPDARSIQLLIQMERRLYGKTLTFDNNIRITIRNTYP